jgi:hypothetical protein
LARQARQKPVGIEAKEGKRRPATAKISLDMGPAAGDEADRDFEKY